MSQFRSLEEAWVDCLDSLFPKFGEMFESSPGLTEGLKGAFLAGAVAAVRLMHDGRGRQLFAEVQKFIAQAQR